MYFFYKGKYKGKIKHISKLMASFLMFVRKKEGTGNLHFGITDFFIFFTHCNVCYITTFESI